MTRRDIERVRAKVTARSHDLALAEQGFAVDADNLERYLVGFPGCAELFTR